MYHPKRRDPKRESRNSGSENRINETDPQKETNSAFLLLVVWIGWRLGHGFPFTLLKNKTPPIESCLTDATSLGVLSPFFPGILLSRKPPETQETKTKSGSGFWKERSLKIMETESTPRIPPRSGDNNGINPYAPINGSIRAVLDHGFSC